MAGVLEPREISDEQDGQNSVHDTDSRYRDRSLKGPKKISATMASFSMMAAVKIGTREAGHRRYIRSVRRPRRAALPNAERRTPSRRLYSSLQTLIAE